MAKNDFWKGFGDFIVAISDSYEEQQKKEEEEKAEIRKEFEDSSKPRIYTRGTVISAMVEEEWPDWDMEQVLKVVTSPERAEAAVSLIRSGRYDWYGVKRVISKL